MDITPSITICPPRTKVAILILSPASCASGCSEVAFVIADPSRQQSAALVIDDHAIMFVFTRVDTGSNRLAHN
jgi:hypothetical protein